MAFAQPLLLLAVPILAKIASASTPRVHHSAPSEWTAVDLGSTADALLADGHCGPTGQAKVADSASEDCSLSMLQLRSQPVSGVEPAVLAATTSQGACAGPWCATVLGFCHLFDSNDPWTMQRAVNQYAEYAGRQEGIKIALTKRDYYEMYHGNVARKISEYLPQGLFSWKFADNFETLQPTGGNMATVVRTGTITFKMGWWRRRMFWNAAVQHLHGGQTFPLSTVEKFNDCNRCPAKMLFTLKQGGLRNVASHGWKIIGLTILKLA